jgi:stage III sporulation protein AA
VLENIPKAQGLMMLLRAMSPQVLAADEITAPEDIAAIEQAAGCGVSLLVTAHGRDRSDLERRPLYRDLLALGVFRSLVTIGLAGERRTYQVVSL